MQKIKCAITQEAFVVSDLEMELRKKLHIDNVPTTAPWVRMRHLAAFWQHWALHNRKCDKTGKAIVSAFAEKCPYPVWHKDEWQKHANPPSAEFDFKKPFFEQAWKLFLQCPIPHKIGFENQNSEYTDDCWHSKNIYLAHSVYKGEDLSYCYRSIQEKDSQFCVYSKNSTLSLDLTNCFHCFETLYSVNCRKISNSAFLFDCRNCSHCLFCCNLRNKQYCYGNQQLTKDEFLKKEKEWNFSSQKIYAQAQIFFQQMMQTLAYFRSTHITHSENCAGDNIEDSRNAQRCFFANNLEDCYNFLRGGLPAKDCLDCVNVAFDAELLFNCADAQGNVYKCSNCFLINQCQFCDYCENCFQCKQCFGCCGLVGKEYHILNKEYSPEEYEALREKIISYMEKTKEWNHFFPGHFAPNPYDESLAGFHFPLSKIEQQELEFRVNENEERKNTHYSLPEEIPDSVDDIENENKLMKKIFWDTEFKKPFQIRKNDIEFSKKIGCPLPNTYYMKRIQKNFRWIPFDGKPRKTTCGKCGMRIQTSWNAKYNEHILCEECYLKKI